LDISFNAVGIDVIQNIPLVDISTNDFVNPVTKTMQTRFVTAKAAAKTMMKQKSGVILTLTATPCGIGYPYTGDLQLLVLLWKPCQETLPLNCGVDYSFSFLNLFFTQFMQISFDD
jgi:hypothetical protein